MNWFAPSPLPGAAAPATNRHGTKAFAATRRERQWVVAALGALMVTGAPAAGTDSAEALSRYRLERAVCTDGKSNQDLQTCLREAGAALQASRQPQSAQRPAVDPANKTKRCDALQGDEARDCIARMNDQGTTSGSVAGGGVLREIVTVTPAAPASAASR